MLSSVSGKIAVVWFAFSILSGAQPTSPEVPPRTWIVYAVEAELPMVDHPDVFLRYHTRKVDDRGDLERDIIESKDGAVARLVRRQNRPLTDEEDAAERARLDAVLHDPAGFARHHKRDRSNINTALELIRAMPDAMDYTYTPGQPQLPNRPARQVVLDFHPNPAFHPASTLQGALASLEGRIWIDAASHHMVRMEGHLFRDANLGWGLIAKVYAGGRLELDQTDATGRWNFSRLMMDLSIRELLVKTVKVKSLTETFQTQVLPRPMTYQDAIQLLLETPLPK